MAVIDSQVDLKQPDLVDQVQTSQNFVAGQPDVPEMHGTAVRRHYRRAGQWQWHSASPASPRTQNAAALRACNLANRGDAGRSGGHDLRDSLSLAKALHYRDRP